MQYVYPACFYKESDGQYTVIFPDLNHLSTCGKNLQDAMRMAVDCLSFYIYSCIKDKDEFNAPSDIKNIDLNNEYEDYTEGFVNLVLADIDEYIKKHYNKSVKKTLTIPAWLNDVAVNEGINFSQVLQTALIEQLHVHDMKQK